MIKLENRMVVVYVTYASFFIRLKAFMYDYILIICYLAKLAVVNLFVFPSLQTFFAGSLVIAQLTGFLMVTLPISLYFILSDSTLFGQSFGKKKANIRVVDRHGKSVSIFRLTIRTIIKFLPWELSHFLVYRLVYLEEGSVPLPYTLIGILIYALMFLYIGTALFTKKKQSIYDLLMRTFVVRDH
ncbi:RDD family protein [Alkalicoccobacillus gibsonii]|uniref:RDD family protein n=1 Tax=Alkalicoccobacillus gibsonii TaxID=79881 RepID=UPI003F7CAE69